MGGEDKAVEIILDNLGKLKDVGITVWYVGHTKRRSVTDVATGEEYDTLTSNMATKYFNAIKTKLHILGVASVDRSIEKVKKKQKIGNDKEIGIVTGESRIITFRDDNFNIDSKSRFAEITPQINLDADEFIEAIKGAIQKAHDKQGGKKSVKEVAAEQAVEREEKIKETVAEIQDEKVDNKRNAELLSEFLELYKVADKDVKATAKAYLDENGISVKDVSTVPTKKLEHALTLVK